MWCSHVVGVEAVSPRGVVDRRVLTADFDAGVGLTTCVRCVFTLQFVVHLPRAAYLIYKDLVWWLNEDTPCFCFSPFLLSAAHVFESLFKNCVILSTKKKNRSVISDSPS